MTENNTTWLLNIHVKQRKWKPCENKLFLNCDKINPLQRKKVELFVNQTKNNPNINKIIIFGSSVRMDCHTGSDVDIYVELDKNEKIQMRHINFIYDLWTNYTVEPVMMKEIIKNGVVVYERK